MKLLIFLTVVAVACALEVGVTVEALSNTVDLSSSPLELRVTFTNLEASKVVMPTQYTALEGVFGDIFDVVASNGEVATYVGKMARRFGNSSTITLAPRESRSVVVDIADSYELVPGTYTIAARAPQSFAYAKANGITVHVTGAYARAEIFGQPRFENCNSGDRSAVVSAEADAHGHAAQGRHCITASTQCTKNRGPTPPSPGAQLTSTWFSNPSGTQVNTVSTCFANMVNRLGDNRFFCRPSGCPSNVYAYVYPTDPTLTQYLCGAFFSVPGERIKTITHEASHFNVICGTRDHVYGRQGCLNLGSAQAISNADNICYFAADSFMR